MSKPYWHDPAINERVEALLKKMSLEQKVGQLTQPERMACTPQDVRQYHLGSVLSGGGSAPGSNEPYDWVAMNDAYWAASSEQDEDHLGIPIMYGVDAIHGNNNVLGATVFPHNIGLGAARDADLIERIAEATALEILATGVEWTFAPTLAVARNLHWGRTYESYSENTSLVAEYAAPFVRGMQKTPCVIACAKHWVGDGGTTSGIDQGDTRVDSAELYSTHIAPYLPAIDQGVMTIMASFNSWNGDKCHGHHHLLTQVLKQELGFEGFIISDWDGIDYLSEDYHQAVAMGMNAGVDMFMVSETWREFIQSLCAHVRAGTVSVSRLNDAVRRVLRVKALSGLLDAPKPSAREYSNSDVFGCEKHRLIAREAVSKSLVLLKNRNDLLPLSKQSRILVAGKNADNAGHQCGGFTVAWQGMNDNQGVPGATSIWQAISQAADNATLSDGGLGLEAHPDMHDVAIVVIGERPYAEGMGDIRDGNDVIVQAGSQIKGLMKVLEPYGNTIELAQSHPEDLAVINNIVARGVPVIAVLLSGRPLVVNKELDKSDAFIAAWLPGSEGSGVSDVLFGDRPFTGKLSFTWPSKTSGGSVDEADALFPFGYGIELCN